MKLFRLLKQSELDRLLAHAKAAGAPWAARWQSRLSPEWAVIEPAALDAAHCMTVEHLMLGEGDYASLAIDTAAVSAISDALFGSSDLSRPRTTANPITASVVVRALTDCAAQIAAPGASGAQWAAIDDVEADDLRKGAGSAWLEARFGGVPVARLVVSLGALRRLGMLTVAASRAQEKCVARAGAVMSARIPLTISLADTPMTIKELRGLAVGDVLVLAQSLDAPLTVRAGNTDAGRAHLGCSNNRYAVELVRQSA